MLTIAGRVRRASRLNRGGEGREHRLAGDTKFKGYRGADAQCPHTDTIVPQGIYNAPHVFGQAEAEADEPGLSALVCL